MRTPSPSILAAYLICILSVSNPQSSRTVINIDFAIGRGKSNSRKKQDYFCHDCKLLLFLQSSSASRRNELIQRITSKFKSNWELRVRSSSSRLVCMLHSHKREVAVQGKVHIIKTKRNIWEKHGVQFCSFSIKKSICWHKHKSERIGMDEGRGRPSGDGVEINLIWRNLWEIYKKFHFSIFDCLKVQSELNHFQLVGGIQLLKGFLHYQLQLLSHIWNGQKEFSLLSLSLLLSLHAVLVKDFGLS